MGGAEGATETGRPRFEPAQLRERMALALDLDDLVVAERLAQRLAPWFSVVKVGLELFSAAGSDAVATMSSLGYRVLLDLKLHDIPTTVSRASRVLGSLGASYLTLHAHGGVEMMRAGVEGLAEGSAQAGLPRPVALGVTVLTSDPGAPAHVLARRVQLAGEAGCGGVVCAASDVSEAKRIAPAMIAVVPGIRTVGSPRNDQARASTPEAALSSGADLVVLGRAVTAAEDPPAAAQAIFGSLT